MYEIEYLVSTPSMVKVDSRAQTPVGMNNLFMHNNPDIFTDPLVFSPERWLQPNSKDLAKYFVPFSRGTRMCTGIK